MANLIEFNYDLKIIAHQEKSSKNGRTIVLVSTEKVSMKTGSNISFNIAAHDHHIFDPGSCVALSHGGLAA